MTEPGDAARGVLLVDKPEGPTSHDAVRLARRSLSERRIGHTGTLDPFATGLLILLVGPATRLAETFSPLEKRYLATVKLGEETDTADRAGEVVHRGEGVDRLDAGAIKAALAKQVGTIQQLPPRYSAKKIDGERAHRKMRRGESVELEPSEVTIHSIEVKSIAGPIVELDVLCSTGTYIRSIARDLGRELAVGGHLTDLRRTEIGHHSVRDAVSWEDLSEPERVRAQVVPTVQGMAHLPQFELSDEAMVHIQNGRAVDAPTLEAEMPFPVLATLGTSLFSVGRVVDGRFQPKKVFPDGA